MEGMDHQDMMSMVSYAVWLELYSTHPRTILIREFSEWALSVSTDDVKWPAAIRHLADQLHEEAVGSYSYKGDTLFNRVTEVLQTLGERGALELLIDGEDPDLKSK